MPKRKGQYTDEEAELAFARAFELREKGDPDAVDAFRAALAEYPDESGMARSGRAFHVLHLALDDEAVGEARRFLGLVRDGTAKCPSVLREVYEDYDRDEAALARLWRSAKQN